MVSEFMLQQTQVARVLDHLPRWLIRFPDISALARASRRDVLLAWSGMGYNRRALYLHAAAKAIVSDHGGEIPSDPEQLRALPGFGRYTAHAVACFGHRVRLALVDVNIRRILSRLSENMQLDSSLLPESSTWDLAQRLLPSRAFFNWNQALMDLGATICTARSPSCASCPLSRQCPSAHRLGSHAQRTGSGSQRFRAPEMRAPAAVREVPRRIYRGRVVEFLRGCKGHCASAGMLHQVLFESEREIERDRLIDILTTLQKDGMIDLSWRRRRVTQLTAFTAPLSELRVCLAE
jgi:A/G-specific adenine glycosylase